jgi:fused signal recognition particle receptor
LINSERNASAASPGLFGRLRERLSKTTQSLGRGIGDLLGGERQLDAALLEELETTLLAADVGVDTTQALITDLGSRLARGELADGRAAYRLLRQDILDIVRPAARPLDVGAAKPFVIMVVGVNGVGKTTTIAKLARRLQADGHKLLLAAGDTFRAAAIEQLQTWGERLNIPVVAQHSGADAAAVAHDALQAAAARAVDVLIVDTAGRQHTHSSLMEELKKIHRVLGKSDASAPHEVLLVLDATTGQNALSQLQHFGNAVKVTGLVLTKLDGTAKGGIALAIAKKTGMPIRYIGIGEGMDDLVEFDAAAYVDAIIGPAA